MVITIAQLRSTKPELRFCAGSSHARGVSDIRNGQNLWQWSLLEIRLNAFRWSTIPPKQFIIIIFIIVTSYYNMLPFFFENTLYIQIWSDFGSKKPPPKYSPATIWAAYWSGFVLENIVQNSAFWNASNLFICQNSVVLDINLTTKEPFMILKCLGQVIGKVCFNKKFLLSVASISQKSLKTFFSYEFLELISFEKLSKFSNFPWSTVLYCWVVWETTRIETSWLNQSSRISFMMKPSFDKTWKYFALHLLNLKLTTYLILKFFSSFISHI